MFDSFPILHELLTRELSLELGWPSSRLNNYMTLFHNNTFDGHSSAHVYIGRIELNFGSSHWEKADLIQ